MPQKRGKNLYFDKSKLAKYHSFNADHDTISWIMMLSDMVCFLLIKWIGKGDFAKFVFPESHLWFARHASLRWI